MTVVQPDDLAGVLEHLGKACVSLSNFLKEQNAIPGAPKILPSTSNDVPSATKAIASISEAVPSASEAVASISEAVPSASQAVSEASEDVPDASKAAPKRPYAKRAKNSNAVVERSRHAASYPASKVAEVVETATEFFERKQPKRRSDPDAPKRPLTPFLLFCKINRRSITSDHPKLSFREVTLVMNKLWENVNRKPYYEQAEELKQEYYVKRGEFERKRRSNSAVGIAQHDLMLDALIAKIRQARPKLFEMSEQVESEGSQSKDVALSQEPVATAPTDESVATAPTDESVATAPTEEPVAIAPTEEPVAAAPTEEPVAATSMQELIETTPTKESVAAAPTQLPVIEASAEPTEEKKKRKKRKRKEPAPEDLLLSQEEQLPTVIPNVVPTVIPNVVPTVIPNVVPTVVPNVIPNVVPNVVPTVVPNVIPTVEQPAQPVVESKPVEPSQEQASVPEAEKKKKRKKKKIDCGTVESLETPSAPSPSAAS